MQPHTGYLNCILTNCRRIQKNKRRQLIEQLLFSHQRLLYSWSFTHVTRKITKMKCLNHFSRHRCRCFCRYDVHLLAITAWDTTYQNISKIPWLKSINYWRFSSTRSNGDRIAIAQLTAPHFISSKVNFHTNYSIDELKSTYSSIQVISSVHFFFFLKTIYNGEETDRLYRMW